MTQPTDFTNPPSYPDTEDWPCPTCQSTIPACDWTPDEEEEDDGDGRYVHMVTYWYAQCQACGAGARRRDV